MQTFIPFPDFCQSAEVLDMKRLGKQRVESFQVLGGLQRVKLITKDQTGTRISMKRKMLNGVMASVPTEVPVYQERPEAEWELVPRVTSNGRTWGDHVIGKMWLGHEYALLDYQKATCDVWTARGGKNDTCYPKSKFLLENTLGRTDANSSMPLWWGREDVHSSHRAALLSKDFEYYSQHGWHEKPEYNYVWPV